MLGQDNADILANMIAAEVALKPGAKQDDRGSYDGGEWALQRPSHSVIMPRD